ncbi:hypothetical protein GW17_00013748 [Ensete ventricosum]|nr:hypothetical protein GW17_00013748 [Ensete ventricosum]
MPANHHRLTLLLFLEAFTITLAMGVHDEEILSRVATGDGHGENSSYFDGWKAYDNDPFHPIHNPNGVIQMGLAENQVMLASGPSSKPSLTSRTTMACRTSVRFMEKARGGRARFDPERIVMSGGATGAQETIAFCLANPGDAFLIPTPYYPAIWFLLRFDRDFGWRTGVQLIPVRCHSHDNFKITEAELAAAYRKARDSKIRVKGILITNPSNPLGTTMDRETLRTLASFANEERIHLVCDEIFSGTVFDGPEYVSVAEILQEDPSICDGDLIHIVYSLSKDLGVPGFRVGIIYSYNDAVVSCARRMSSFGLVSTQTQRLLASMLGDDDFTTDFLAETRRRLMHRHRAFTAGLEGVGIRCLQSNAGLFCWMSLKPLLKDATAEAEVELWRVIVDEVKLNISPGSSFHCAEPGWFRACFANMDEDTMETALRRIRTFVRRADGAAAPRPKTKKRWDATLRLSLPRRLEELTVLTPRLMSPRSPLVQAAT